MLHNILLNMLSRSNAIKCCRWASTNFQCISARHCRSVIVIQLFFCQHRTKVSSSSSDSFTLIEESLVVLSFRQITLCRSTLLWHFKYWTYRAGQLYASQQTPTGLLRCGILCHPLFKCHGDWRAWTFPRAAPHTSSCYCARAPERICCRAPYCLAAAPGRIVFYLLAARNAIFPAQNCKGTLPIIAPQTVNLIQYLRYAPSDFRCTIPVVFLHSHDSILCYIAGTIFESSLNPLEC